MTHGSLFSGIGGFDLAAEWMGWENVFHCEWNPFGQRVLKHYWPNAKSYNDITKTDFTVHRGSIDILTGGFPCQPYSTAGKRLGKADERHLFPEMLRAIKEIQPRWIIGENVRGLVSWNGGMVFDEVYADLESQGYEVLSFLIPAASVNAPHKRDRVWFVAHAYNAGGSTGLRQVQSADGKISKRNNDAESCDSNSRNAADTDSERWERRQRIHNESGKEQGESIIIGQNVQDTGDASNTDNPGTNEQMRSQREWSEVDKRWQGQPQFESRENGNDGHAADTECYGGRKNNRIRKSKQFNENGSTTNWQTFPTVSPICDGNDGLSNRLDGITFSKWRNESIKGGGNAIVPQVAFQIFKAIEGMYKHEHMERPTPTT